MSALQVAPTALVHGLDPRPDPRVGVVVLTYNRRDEVVGTVEWLLELPERPRIVVVDNASSDGTAEALAERFPTVTCLRMARNLGAGGRNAGVRACQTPYVAFCDDDTRWEPGALRRAADLLDGRPRLAVISGRVLVGRENRVDPTCDQMSTSPLPAGPTLPGPALLGFMAGASVVRRSAFLAAGGFEWRFGIGGEETLLSLRLVSVGWELAYVDDVVTHHYPSSTGRDNPARRRTVTRNALWATWLCRPLPAVLARTLAVGLRGRHDPIARAALIEAARGLPWVLARRRVVPPRVERAIQLLESSGRWSP